MTWSCRHAARGPVRQRPDGPNLIIHSAIINRIPYAPEAAQLIRDTDLRTGHRRARALSTTATSAAVVPATTWLVSIGIFTLCCAASLFLIGAFFFVKRLMRTIKRLDFVLEGVGQELPGLAASVRLTGLEMADCILEFQQLSKEVTGGIKASAQMVRSTEQSLREGGKLMRHAFTSTLIPGFRKRARASADILEYALRRNASMNYTHEPAAAQAAAAATQSIRQLRSLLAALATLNQVLVQGAAFLESRAGQDASMTATVPESAPPPASWHPSPSALAKVLLSDDEDSASNAMRA